MVSTEQAFICYHCDWGKQKVGRKMLQSLVKVQKEQQQVREQPFITTRFWKMCWEVKCSVIPLF